MFDNFNIGPFKKAKPPSDHSFDTAQEIKNLKKTPLRKDLAKKYDDIESAFKKTAEENNVKDYDEKIASNLIKKSAPIILKLKNYHNRPRPYDLDKNLSAFKMKSMNTPSYPSGHSAQGYLIGSVLKKKYGKGSAFMKTAKNISDSRISARAHYPSDSKLGKDLGIKLSEEIEKS